MQKLQYVCLYKMFKTKAIVIAAIHKSRKCSLKNAINGIPFAFENMFNE